MDAKTLSAEEAVAGYKSLQQVEKAFRNMKTVVLELRPVYHKTDARIRAHIFLCMLAYYIQWHARVRLAPLFDENGINSERRWSMRMVIERLKSIQKISRFLNEVFIDEQTTTPDSEQERIVELLDEALK